MRRKDLALLLLRCAWAVLRRRLVLDFTRQTIEGIEIKLYNFEYFKAQYFRSER